MNSLLRAARRQPVDVTPVKIMRQAGRYLPEYRAIREKIEFLLRKTPDRCRGTVQPVRRLGRCGNHLLRHPHPHRGDGDELELGDRGPHFPSPLRTAADIDKLVVPDPVETTGFVAEAIGDRAALHDSVPVIGFAGAPFTLAAYMVEGGGSKSFVLIKRLMFEQPKLAHTLFERLTRTLIPYLEMQVAAGVRIVQIFNSWGGELSPRDFETFSLPYLTRMVQALQAKGVPVIVFGTAMSTHLPLLRKTGADVLWVRLAHRHRPGAYPGRARRRHSRGTSIRWRSSFRRPSSKQRVADILRRAGPAGHIFPTRGTAPPSRRRHRTRRSTWSRRCTGSAATSPRRRRPSKCLGRKRPPAQPPSQSRARKTRGPPAECDCVLGERR